MTPRLAWAVALACAAAAGCARPGIGAAECEAMPVKGWDDLLARPAFASLGHRKDMVFDPLSETSRLLVADSNIDYATLLTFVFAHRARDGANPGPESPRCIRDVSLTLRMPLDAERGETLAAFEDFLKAKGMPAALAARVESARASAAAFAPLTPLAGTPVSAGIVESGARGRFFRVEIASAPPAPARGAAR